MNHVWQVHCKIVDDLLQKKRKKLWAVDIIGECSLHQRLGIFYFVLVKTNDELLKQLTI